MAKQAKNLSFVTIFKVQLKYNTYKLFLVNLAHLRVEVTVPPKTSIFIPTIETTSSF